MLYINKCSTFKYLRYLYDSKCLTLWVCYIMYILCIGAYEKKKKKGEKRDCYLVEINILAILIYS